MRSPGFLLPFILLSSTLFSQANSVRLFGMGNVSIAVPDSFGEAFINPARATRLSGIAARLSPSLERRSNPAEVTSSDPAGYSSEAKGENTSVSSSLPAYALAALGPIHVGAFFSKSANSSSTANNSRSFSAPSSWYSDEYKSETSAPQTTYSALAALDLYVVQVGISGSLFSSSGDSWNSSNYSSSSGPPSSSRYEYSDESSGKSLTVGGSIGSSETFELGASLGIGSATYKSKPTKHISNGVYQPIVDPYLGRLTETPVLLAAQSRINLSENFLFGISLRRQTSKDENFSTQRFYDQNSSGGTYEERKTSENKFEATEIGAGVTLRTGSSLVSVEFLLSPGTITENIFFTTDYIYDNQIFRRGTISNKYEFKISPKILRVGAEVGVLSSFVVRAGAESLWGTEEISGEYVTSKATTKLTGIPISSLAATAGFTVHLTLFQVDYAVAMRPYSFYLSGPSFGFTTQDISFAHTLSVQVELSSAGD